MTSLSTKELNEDIDRRVDEVKAFKDVAKEVTLTEFIEQYPREDRLVLGSLWYSVNPHVADENDDDLRELKFEGTS
jgi:Lon protease-like protein|tara:strand:- start:200 stop:427 length:228 start_codon:yes stop_codon:yes gene_type:complete